MSDLRGREISMIFQNPRAALNPIRQVGKQIEDVLIRHAQTSHDHAKARAIEALERVRIRDAAKRYHAYPFELSGGMCQRVVIAIALACKPQLLIADEPTTGLDVTTQKAVMELVRDLTRSQGMSTLLITHDLGLAGEYCDRIVVMEKGDVVEQQDTRDLFTAPAHPYTRRLIRSTPHAAARHSRSAAGGHCACRRRRRPRPSTTDGAAARSAPIWSRCSILPQDCCSVCRSRGKKRSAGDACRRRHQLQHRARRKRRSCRRIGLWQVDDLGDGDAPARSTSGSIRFKGRN